VALHPLPPRARLVALALEADTDADGSGSGSGIGHRVIVVTASGALLVLGGGGDGCDGGAARAWLSRAHGAPAGAALLRDGAGGTHLLVRTPPARAHRVSSFRALVPQ
jgi:hypothetical protein